MVPGQGTEVLKKISFSVVDKEQPLGLIVDEIIDLINHLAITNYNRIEDLWTGSHSAKMDITEKWRI